MGSEGAAEEAEEVGAMWQDGPERMPTLPVNSLPTSMKELSSFSIIYISMLICKT